MKVTFDTQNAEEVIEVALLLGSMKITLDTPPVKTPSAPKVEKVIPKATPAPKKAPTPSKPKGEITVTLGDLKDLAKDKAQSSGRDAVKNTIGEFAPKLTEVKVADYLPLCEALKAL